MGLAVASVSTDLPAAPWAMRASLSVMLGLSAVAERELLLVSVELGVTSFSGTGGVGCLAAGAGVVGEGAALDRGSEGTGGVVPSCEISMRGFDGARGLEPEVAFEAELEGRGGRTNVASGASSESSEDESELSSESLSFARDLLRARSDTSKVSTGSLVR